MSRSPQTNKVLSQDPSEEPSAPTQTAYFPGDEKKYEGWREFTVYRDGDIPLVFEGKLLGDGETSVDVLDKLRNAWTKRGHIAAIFKTRSGKYVISFEAWSGISTESSRYKAAVLDDHTHMRVTLATFTPRGIPEAALIALSEAGTNDADLANEAVERI